MRTALGTLVELVGFGCLVAAAYLLNPIGGLAALGVVLIIAAQAGGRR